MSVIIDGTNGVKVNGTQLQLGPCFSAYQSTSQSLPSSATHSKINLQTKEFDTNNAFDTSLSRFQPTVAGYYFITGSIGTSGGALYFLASIFKNGSEWKRGNQSNGLSASLIQETVSCLVYLNGSTDYIELMGVQVSGVSISLTALAISTYMQGHFVRGT